MKHDAGGVVLDPAQVPSRLPEWEGITLHARARTLEEAHDRLVEVVETVRELESELLSPGEFDALVELCNQVGGGAGSRLVEVEGLKEATVERFVDLAVVLLPGTVFSVVLEEALLGCLTGIRTVLLPSRRMEGAVVRLVTTLRRYLPSLASAIFVAPSSARGSFLSSEAVGHLRIYGADETVLAVSEIAAPGVTVQAYGSMLSAALVEATAVSTHVLPLVERLTDDIATWRMLGCFSPATVYLVADEAKAFRFCSSLRDSVDRLSSTLDSPLVPPFRASNAAAIGAMQGARVYRGAVSIVCRAPGQPTENPLAGSVQIVVRRSVRDAVSELAAKAERLSSLGVEIRTDGEVGLTYQECHQLAHRVVPIGMMQRPLFERQHDGQARLRPLLSEPSFFEGR